MKVFTSYLLKDLWAIRRIPFGDKTLTSIEMCTFALEKDSFI